MLESIISSCPLPILLELKLMSRAWRAIVRRVLCDERWLAGHLQLPALLSLGAADSVLLTRLRAHPDEAYLKGKDGAVLLHAACARPVRSVEVVERLLAAPSAAQQRDAVGLTPLHVAAAAAAPAAIIEALVVAYPDSSRQRVWNIVALPRGGNTCPQSHFNPL